MSVQFESVASNNGYGVTSLTINSLSITTNANRVAVLGLSANGDLSNISGACGGASASLIVSDAYAYKAIILGVINPASGSQTASASWTTAASCLLAAMIFSGAHQSTQFTDPKVNHKYGSSPLSISITSDPGDITTSVTASGSEATTNQTLKYGVTTGLWCYGDIGGGAGNTTHTWSWSGTERQIIVGCNIEQAEASGGPFPFYIRNSLHGGMQRMGGF